MNIFLRTLKAFLPITLIFFAVLILSFSREPEMYQGLSDDSKILYSFIDCTGKLLEKKYQMRQSAKGIGGMDKVWLMALSSKDMVTLLLKRRLEN